MVLRRKRAPLPDGLPVELFDPDSLVWASEKRYEVWLGAEGLARHAKRTDGPVDRHYDGACAVAIRAGSYRTYGASSHPWPNLAFLVDLGVPLHVRRAESSASARFERMLRTI